MKYRRLLPHKGSNKFAARDNQDLRFVIKELRYTDDN